GAHLPGGGAAAAAGVPRGGAGDRPPGALPGRLLPAGAPRGGRGPGPRPGRRRRTDLVPVRAVAVERDPGRRAGRGGPRRPEAHRPAGAAAFRRQLVLPAAAARTAARPVRRTAPRPPGPA